MVGARPAVQEVLPRVGAVGHPPRIAEEPVGALPTEERVIAPLPEQAVGTALAIDHVIAPTAPGVVAPRTGVDRVPVAGHWNFRPEDRGEPAPRHLPARSEAVLVGPVEALREPVLITEQVVIAGAPNQYVDARAPDERIVVRARDQNVITLAAGEPVALLAAALSALAGGDRSGHLGARIGIQAIIAGAAGEDVAIGAALHDVIARAGIDPVVAAARLDRVGATAEGIDGVVAAADLDEVGAGAVDDAVHATRHDGFAEQEVAEIVHAGL